MCGPCVHVEKVHGGAVGGGEGPRRPRAVVLQGPLLKPRPNPAGLETSEGRQKYSASDEVPETAGAVEGARIWWRAGSVVRRDGVLVMGGGADILSERRRPGGCDRGLAVYLAHIVGQLHEWRPTLRCGDGCIS